MTEKRIFFVIALLGILSSCVLGVINGGIFKTKIEQWGNDAWQYNATALALVQYHTFHDPSSKFFGAFQKGPGYPLFLALIYMLFGPHPIAVFCVQLVLWVVALWLLWKISAIFLAGRWALAPPGMLAVYWGASAYIFDINSDLLALFFSLGLAWSFYWYLKDGQCTYGIAQGCFLGFLVLIKPIALYFIPVYLLSAFLILGFSSKRIVFSLAVTLSIAVVMVSWWSWYNWHLLHTPQLASGGLTLMRRADDVMMSSQRFFAFTVASLFGDLVADKMYPGYADAPEPYTAISGARERTYYARQLPDKSNETALQKEQLSEAKLLIQQHPVKFLFTSIPYLIRLNIPVNQRGVEMIRTFVAAKDSPDVWLKIGIMLFIRIMWFSWIGVAGYGVYRALRSRLWNAWMILAFIVYFNGMYALVSHAEARYILPVLPFYFIFFVFALHEFYKKFFPYEYKK